MDIQVARKVSIDSYLEIMKDPPKRRIKKKSFIKACEEYLEHKHQQAHRKQITPRSAGSYEQRVYQRIIPFAKFAGVKVLVISTRIPLHHSRITTSI